MGSLWQMLSQIFNLGFHFCKKQYSKISNSDWIFFRRYGIIYKLWILKLPFWLLFTIFFQDIVMHCQKIVSSIEKSNLIVLIEPFPIMPSWKISSISFQFPSKASYKKFDIKCTTNYHKSSLNKFFKLPQIQVHSLKHLSYSYSVSIGKGNFGIFDHGKYDPRRKRESLRVSEAAPMARETRIWWNVDAGDRANDRRRDCAYRDTVHLPDAFAKLTFVGWVRELYSGATSIGWAHALPSSCYSLLGISLLVTSTPLFPTVKFLLWRG